MLRSDLLPVHEQRMAEESFEISPILRQLFRGLEIVFWILSCLLALTSVGLVVYQVSVLFVPFWLHILLRRDSAFSFPSYFYRVYGDDVDMLTYEHYGYLLSAVVVTGVVGYNITISHPWKEAQKKPKTE